MAVAETDNRPADRPGHAAEDKRPAQRQVQAVDSRFGDAKNPGRDSRPGQYFLPRVAAAQENPQRRSHLPHHRRQQHRQHRILAEHRQVVDHQRDQPPVQAKDHANLPQGAHCGPCQPRRNRVDNLVTVGQQLAQPGGNRADGQEGQRHHHCQANGRSEEVFHR